MSDTFDHAYEAFVRALDGEGDEYGVDAWGSSEEGAPSRMSSLSVGLRRTASRPTRKEPKPWGTEIILKAFPTEAGVSFASAPGRNPVVFMSLEDYEDLLFNFGAYGSQWYVLSSEFVKYFDGRKWCKQHYKEVILEHFKKENQ